MDHLANKLMAVGAIIIVSSKNKNIVWKDVRQRKTLNAPLAMENTEDMNYN